MSPEALQIIKELSEKFEKLFLEKAAAQEPENHFLTTKPLKPICGSIQSSLRREKGHNIRVPNKYLYGIIATAAKRSSFSDSEEGRNHPIWDSGFPSTGYKIDRLLRAPHYPVNSGAHGTKYNKFSKSAPVHNTEVAIPTTATNNHPQSVNFCGRRRGRGRGSHRCTNFFGAPPAIDALSVAQQAEDHPRGPSDPEKRDLAALDSESHRGIPKKKSLILHPPLRNSKENGLTKTSTRPKEVESAPQSASFRTIAESSYVHEDPSTNIFICESTRNTYFILPGRSSHPWDLEATMCGKHASSILISKGSWIQNQVGEVNHESFQIDYTPVNCDQLARDDTQGTSGGKPQRSCELGRHVLKIEDKPHRRTEQTGRSDRMVTIGTGICSNYETLLGKRHGSVRLEGEQKSGNLLNLVTRQAVHRPELPLIQLVGLVQPLLLPTLEYDRTSDYGGETGVTDNHTGNVAVEKYDMLPGPPAIICKLDTVSITKNSGPRSKCGKYPLSNK
ncbi:hypothetical protein AYI68_g6118 [Smittium mucronatum]|uniref:Uncharacterized protein n=1 Tax=Smittium mucronatum TaxID=133383 RepID=A0A1R0GSD9_9FUNG|nr:hypothetical protein AYI68_g6118 [Smittium mucronatum]